ncbi:MAG TPA: helix-turn-helix domain-containing protein [Gemmatimonadales bacterium]|nr:helix-turn-helix domain-containing protein [Gemmatimonadales bacterium]
MGTSAAVHVIDDADRAATVLHPLRLRILAELDRPDSAAGLARRLGLPRQKLNYHLRQLERQGLVEAVGQQQKRGCTERLLRAVAQSYLISPATLGDLAVDPARVQDHVSSAYLVAVAAQVIREVAALRDRAQRANKGVPTLTLQADVRFASAKAQHAFAQELSRQVARLVAKYHDDRASGGRRFRFVAGAYPAPAPPPAHDAIPEATEHQEDT